MQDGNVAAETIKLGLWEADSLPDMIGTRINFSFPFLTFS